jgi:hypothetical protein
MKFSNKSKEDTMRKMLTAMMPIVALAFLLLFMAGCHARVVVRTSASGHVSGQAGETAKAHPVVQAQPKNAQPTPPTNVTPTPPTPVQPAFTPTTGEGVTITQKPCPNKAEELNGIDDDCDGLVDEDWVKSGPLQITLWWSGGPDLDLAVTDPQGNVISVKKKTSPSGGEMDKDSRSACKGGETIENVYWVKAPPKGTYSISVNYYSSCGQKANPPDIEANVGISYNGQFVGPFKKVLKSKEKATIVQFALE